MIVLFFILLLVLTFYDFNRGKVSSFHKDYIDKEQTTAIKGGFAVLILFSHMRSYLNLGNSVFDIAYNYIMNSIGQLMVVMFLFYSGYGVLESYKKKPCTYEKNFLKNRFGKTLLHFDMAVFLFLIVDVILGIKYRITDYIFCWIGWKAIGNSKWFIFDILALYIITYLMFKVVKIFARNQTNEIRIQILSLMSIVGVSGLIAVLYFTKRNEGPYWYNTVLSYSCGMLFSCYKNTIENLMKSWKGWGSIFIVDLILFARFYQIDSFVAYNICTCFFALGVVFITMKIKFANSILFLLGKMSFSIYILQRLPMIIMSYVGLNQYKYIFAFLSIVFALLLAWGFEKILKKIDKKLFY